MEIFKDIDDRLTKTFAAAISIALKHETDATVRIPIKVLDTDSIIADCLKVEIKSDATTVGWLYHEINLVSVAMTTKTGKKALLTPRSFLAGLVQEGCTKKEFSDTPSPYKLTKGKDGKIITLVPLKDIAFLEMELDLLQ